MYPVSVLCGDATESFQEGVVTGSYKTALNVFNPSPRERASIRVEIARSLPYQSSGAQSALPGTDLAPLAAMEIECDQIRNALPLPGTAQFRTGYLIVFASRDVEVTAVYSGRPRGSEVASVDVLKIEARRPCGPGEIGPAGTCKCPKGLGGRRCEVVVAKGSGPTFLRMKWVGLDRPGDVFRSENDCITLEITNFTDRELLANVEFYGTLDGDAKGMISPLSSLPLEARATETIERCLRDFEGQGGASDLIDLAFSATLNARATVFGGLDGQGGRLDRIFAPTGYFHVEPDPELFVPYRAVLYDGVARRRSFGGGDYAGRFGFALPGGGIYIPDTHPDELFDEGGPAPPPVIVPEP